MNSQLGFVRVPPLLLMRRVAPLAITIALFSCGGFLIGKVSSNSQKPQANDPVTSEIVISKDQGLTFRSEDRRPLAKIGTDEAGSYFNLFSNAGKPIVRISSLHEKGAVIVGNNDGSYIYMSALENGGSIVMVNQYGKQVLELVSGNDGGRVVLGEGRQGYKIVQLDANKDRKGEVRVYRNGEMVWQTP